MSNDTEYLGTKRSHAKERIYQFKVDETKLNVDKIANVSKMVNNRVSDIDKRLDEFKASVQESLNEAQSALAAVRHEMNQKFSELSGLSEQINTCNSKCDELLDSLNAIMEVIEDHKNKIELLGK